MSKSIHAIITGRVQGVNYRNWTVDTAKALGVEGWVRNLKDGSVEAVFSGSDEQLDAMLNACRKGPAAAHVDDIKTTTHNELIAESGFHRKATV